MAYAEIFRGGGGRAKQRAPRIWQKERCPQDLAKGGEKPKLTLPYLSPENKIKILSRKTRPMKDFKEAQGRNGGEAKSFLRTVAVSGAGVLCFPDTPIICLRVSHDIDAVIWVKNTQIISTLFLTLIT